MTSVVTHSWMVNYFLPDDEKLEVCYFCFSRDTLVFVMLILSAGVFEYMWFVFIHKALICVWKAGIGTKYKALFVYLAELSTVLKLYLAIFRKLYLEFTKRYCLDLGTLMLFYLSKWCIYWSVPSIQCFIWMQVHTHTRTM